MEKIKTTKNNIKGVKDMIFPKLSKTIDINQDTLDILSAYAKYSVPKDPYNVMK